MGGKGAILLILGFSLIFLVVGQNFAGLSTRAVENESKYYIDAVSHNLAITGANMAANQLFMDKYWEAGYTNLSFCGGVINVYISNHINGLTGKTTICHKPENDGGTTILIATSAVSAHLSHGDYLGPCGGAEFDDQIATIISEGTYKGVTKTIIVQLKPSNFAKFGNFYSSMSAYPATGDTFNGPFHVNAKLTTDGTPVFWGKVTTKNGLKKQGTPADPKFYGGYETGVDLPLQFDTTGLRSHASRIFRDTTNNNYITNVRLYFNNDATVTYSQSINGGTWSTPKTVSVTSFAPSGVVYVERGNIYTKGTLDGRITIAATKINSTGAGQVFFEDNLVYKDDPRVIPTSNDMLGIIAESNIRIQDNANTRGKSINTHASMFSLTGNIGPEYGLINQSFLGNWNILGGLIAKDTRQTAVYSGSTPVKGLRFVHAYDTRFLLSVPPYFPHTQNFEVVSWYE